MITNTETPHVIGAPQEHLSAGGALRWIAQVAVGENANMLEDNAAMVREILSDS